MTRSPGARPTCSRCFADTVVAPAAAPPIDDTDAVAFFDRFLGQSPALNRLGLRAMLYAFELAPLATGAGARLRRLPAEQRARGPRPHRRHGVRRRAQGAPLASRSSPTTATTWSCAASATTPTQSWPALTPCASRRAAGERAASNRGRRLPRRHRHLPSGRAPDRVRRRPGRRHHDHRRRLRDRRGRRRRRGGQGAGRGRDDRRDARGGRAGTTPTTSPRARAT